MSSCFQHIPPSTEYHTQQQWPSAGTAFLPHLSLWLHGWVISCQGREFTTQSHNLEKKLCFAQGHLGLMSCIMVKPLYSFPLQNLLNIQLSQHEESSSFLGRWKLLEKILIHNRTKSAKQPFKNSNKDTTVCPTEMKQKQQTALFCCETSSPVISFCDKKKAFLKDQHWFGTYLQI